MSNDFQQTVNLKDRLEKKQPALNPSLREGRGKPKPKREPAPKPKPKPDPSFRERRGEPARKPAEDIDEVYKNSDAVVSDQPDLRTISRPQASKNVPNFKRAISAVLALIIVAVGAYFIFFNSKTQGDVAGVVEPEARWYAVKLTNGEVYYGQIADIKADPVEIKKVYYNYDQLNEGKETSDSGNLRLVKRGQETYGPEGTMNIVRSQVVFMEPLKEDSKVLRAILDYEH